MISTLAQAILSPWKKLVGNPQNVPLGTYSAPCITLPLKVVNFIVPGLWYTIHIYPLIATKELAANHSFRGDQRLARDKSHHLANHGAIWMAVGKWIESQLHPWKLTYPLKIDGWKLEDVFFLSSLFRGHVNFLWVMYSLSFRTCVFCVYLRFRHFPNHDGLFFKIKNKCSRIGSKEQPAMHDLYELTNDWHPYHGGHGVKLRLDGCLQVPLDGLDSTVEPYSPLLGVKFLDVCLFLFFGWWFKAGTGDLFQMVSLEDVGL